MYWKKYCCTLYRSCLPLLGEGTRNIKHLPFLSTSWLIGVSSHPLDQGLVLPAGTMEGRGIHWLGSAQAPGNMICFLKTQDCRWRRDCSHLQTFPKHLAVRSDQAKVTGPASPGNPSWVHQRHGLLWCLGFESLPLINAVFFKQQQQTKKNKTKTETKPNQQQNCSFPAHTCFVTSNSHLPQLPASANPEQTCCILPLRSTGVEIQIQPFIHPCIFRGKGEQRQARACQGHTSALWFPNTVRPVAALLPHNSPTRKAAGFQCCLGPQQHLGLSQMEQILLAQRLWASLSFKTSVYQGLASKTWLPVKDPVSQSQWTGAEASGSCSGCRRGWWRWNPHSSAAIVGKKSTCSYQQLCSLWDSKPTSIFAREAPRCRAQQDPLFNPEDLWLQHEVSHFLNSPNRSYVNLTFFLKCLQCLFSPAIGLF